MAAPTNAGVSKQERRHLTVMFCDIVGSTQLSEKLDPEDFADLLVRYQEICQESLERYGGYLAKFLGDGILAYFGYPDAVENSGLSAANTGLDLLRAIKQHPWREELGLAEAIQIRIGIDTGTVVVGDMSTGEAGAIVGATPHVASRLQGEARPGEMVVSAATHELILGKIETEFVGNRELRGVSKPVSVYRVISALPFIDQFDRMNGGADSQFVGRKKALEKLTQLWHSVRQGNPTITLLTGDAGMGKSRLTREFEKLLRGNGDTEVIQLSTTPFHGGSDYFPLIDWMSRKVLQFTDELSGEERYARVVRHVGCCGGDPERDAPVLAALIGIEGSPPPPPGYTPEAQAQHLRLMFTRCLGHAAEKGALLVVEDLHWMDPSTFEWIRQLKQHLENVPLMILVTSRPSEKTSELEADVHIPIEPMSASQTTGLANDIAGARLPSPVLKNLVEWAAGNPLFIEELTRSIVRSDMLVRRGDHYDLNRALPTLNVPRTLEDALLVRLQTLGEAREVALVASIFTGRATIEGVAKVWEGDTGYLDQHFHRLLEAGVMETEDGSFWSFRHVLLKEAAYKSILRKERQAYHRRMASLLEADQSMPGFGKPEILAHHLARGGRETEAIPHLIEAGVRMVRLSSYLEAIKHLEVALEIIAKHGPMVEAELSVRILLGAALVSVRGFAADEVLDCYARAERLSHQIEEKSTHFAAMWGLWVYYLVRGELKRAEGFAQTLLDLGETSGEDGMLVEGNWTLGDVKFWMGDLAKSRELLEKAGAIYVAERHHPNAYRYGQDPGVSSMCYLSFALWFSGEHRAGLETVEKALSLAKVLRHPHTEAWALGFATMVNLVSNHLQRAEDLAEQTLAFANEQVMPFWQACGATFLGLTRVRGGRIKEGRALAEQGYAACGAIGARVLEPLFATMVAECQLADGDAVAAMTVVEEGLKRVYEKEEWVCAPPLLRLKGIILGLGGNLEAAEVAFWEGLEISLNNGSDSFTLDLASDLAGLPLSPKRSDIVRGHLERMVERFAETPTADVTRARAFLE